MTYLDATYQDTWDTRNSRLAELGTTYDDFLKSEYWANVKKKAKTRSNYKRCEICGKTSNLDLHHISYKWLGTKDELRGIVALCREHHCLVHDFAKINNVSVRLSSWYHIFINGDHTLDEINKKLKSYSKENKFFSRLLTT